MNSIVIGVDASEHSQDAVALGRRLALASSAPVFVACTFPYSDPPNRGENFAYREYLRGDAEETATRMRSQLDIGRARIRIVAEPSVAKGLYRIAHAEHAAIVVVGSTHTGRMGRVAPGSTAERLLHGSPCAVAIAPQGYRERDEQPIRRIGVAYDGSPEAAQALAAAVELARAFGAGLELIGVAVLHMTPPMLSAEGYGDLWTMEKERVDRKLADAIAGVPEGISADATRLDGDPAALLAARTASLDLLVMGSRGYGPMHAVLAGAVSARVVREAHCPVIVVPRGVERPFEGLLATDHAATA